MTTPYTCPGCSSSNRASRAAFPSSVFTLNYVYRSQKEALSAPKAPFHLEECAQCGLVHIALCEPVRSCYDAAYENTQEHSAAFRQHLLAVRDLLVSSLGSDRPYRVLEVGCGKGGFLRLLGETEGWSGDGYDTTYDGASRIGNLHFHREYVTPELLAGERYDVIVCRHVIEHIPAIGEFLQMLADITLCTGASRLMLETPDFGWIVRNGAFWDVFHEHRNYFTASALSELASKAGLEILEHRCTFGAQYQNLVLGCQAGGEARDAHRVPPPDSALDRLRDATSRKVESLASAIEEAAQGGDWAIWGAGAKGVCLANHLEHRLGFSPSVVFDINPAKKGSFVPGHGTPVLAPTPESLRCVSLVVVANPVYATEIAETISAAGATDTRLFILQ